jgi:glycosyltransferase involved in cell wall biosynthesis
MLEELKGLFNGDPRVKFLGRVEPKDMPLVYSLADLFVFPSTMDTFGMSVLEAQSCELPALVTNIGGPQEIILANETGWVVPADNAGAWVDAVLKARDMCQQDPAGFSAMKRAARRRVKELFPWEDAIRELYAPSGKRDL